MILRFIKTVKQANMFNERNDHLHRYKNGRIKDICHFMRKKEKQNIKEITFINQNCYFWISVDRLLGCYSHGPAATIKLNSSF